MYGRFLQQSLIYVDNSGDILNSLDIRYRYFYRRKMTTSLWCIILQFLQLDANGKLPAPHVNIVHSEEYIRAKWPGLDEWMELRSEQWNQFLWRTLSETLFLWLRVANCDEGLRCVVVIPEDARSSAVIAELRRLCVDIWQPEPVSDDIDSHVAGVSLMLHDKLMAILDRFC